MCDHSHCDHHDETNQNRRRLLQGAAGLVLASLPMAGNAQKGARNIFRLRGDVRVNGRAANVNTPIFPGDTVTTGYNGFVIFAVDRDVFQLRGNSRLTIEARNGIWDTMRLGYGALLSVFETGRKRNVSTPIVTAGIRGTGCYVETDPSITYFCNCYGTIDLQGRQGGNETLQANHHDARWVRAAPGMRTTLAKAPMRGHADAELVLLEQVVGRRPPESFFGMS